ncbi:MAG: DUF3800 domain-containing protein [Candidatus Hodarchaeota archaeon]
MYLSYADESGYSGGKFDRHQPVQTMVAILPNAYNFHRSDSEFKEVFNIINAQIPISEIKGEQIYRGRGAWENIKAESRDHVIEFYLHWIESRKHKLIVTAIDNGSYFGIKKEDPQNPIIQKLQCPYLFATIHIALVVQKLHRTQRKNKGKTLLIFDEQDQFSDKVTELIFNPPEFIDDFVDFNQKKEKVRLNQIVDTAFFVKSHHSSMAQVVDIIAYLMRLYLELSHYGLEESYQGESKKLKGWIDQVKSKFVPFSKVYPKGKKPFTTFLQSIKAKGI